MNEDRKHLINNCEYWIGFTRTGIDLDDYGREILAEDMRKIKALLCAESK